MQQLTGLEVKTINSLAYYFSLVLKSNTGIDLTENTDKHAPFTVFLNEMFQLITTEFTEEKSKVINDRFTFDVVTEINESVPKTSSLYDALDTNKFATYAIRELYVTFGQDTETENEFIGTHPTLKPLLETIQRAWHNQTSED